MHQGQTLHDDRQAQNLQWNTNDYALPALWLLRGKLSLVISFLTPGSSLIWREMLVKKQFLHKHTYCPAKLVNIGFFHLKFLTWLEVRPPQHFFVPFPLILCHYFCHPRWLLREKTVY